jgi:hypothetical protein
MLTSLEIRNFKSFSHANVELGPVTVLCGPNNAGKTAALQALALWRAGLQAWLAERGSTSIARERPGVQINRRDLVSIPVPSTSMLWHGLRTRLALRDNGRQETQNVRIDIVVRGVGPSGEWACGLEFDYQGQESLYCRPLRMAEGRSPARMPIPEEAGLVRVALLPAMSGLAAVEPKWEPGRIDVLIGEGQTAQVLRNLCYQLLEVRSALWDELVRRMRALFGVTLLPPVNIAARGEITMTYRDRDGTELDLSSAGRGQQQVLLLLAYVLANPGAVLLLDEPDAHLEVVRQREIFNLLSDMTRGNGSQIVAASHSEVILEEAAGKETLVAFVGKPHRIDDRGSQVKKWLAEYPIDHLYQAELKGFVLYLEGATDLSILRSFAERLAHPAQRALESPSVHYVGNDTAKVVRHFRALREAKSDVVGVALFDRLDRTPQDSGALQLIWARREIENYLLSPAVLEAWAGSGDIQDLFAQGRVAAMRDAIARIGSAQQDLGKDIWSPDIEATDDVLDPIFRRYFGQTGQGVLFRKADYHELVAFIEPAEIDPEVTVKLDAIHTAFLGARPRQN